MSNHESIGGLENSSRKDSTIDWSRTIRFVSRLFIVYRPFLLHCYRREKIAKPKRSERDAPVYTRIKCPKRQSRPARPPGVSANKPLSCVCNVIHV